MSWLFSLIEMVFLIMRTKFANFGTEFTGGLSGAIAVLPQTIGLSVLLFTSFGLDASSGAVAGLVGAIILLLTSGLMGATKGMISAPNGPVTMLLIGFAGQLSTEFQPSEIMIIISSVLVFTGVFQIALGLLRGGELIKLIPYPVVTSMISAIGILMILSQLGSIVPSSINNEWIDYIPIIVALSTLVGIILCKKFMPRIPEILFGLLIGILVYAIVTKYAAGVRPEWVIGTLPTLNVDSMLLRFDGINLNQLPWKLIITTAAALTILVLIDCLLTALVADSQTGARHSSGKELVAQGVGQALIGIVGGVGGGGTKGSTMACTMAGGRRWSPVFAALIVLSMLMFGQNLGQHIPLSALSGVIIYIGIKMINLNMLSWFKSRYTRVYAINAIMVLVVSIAFDVTTAVAFGLVFSVINFIWSEIKRPLIRRESNIIEYPSPRKRSKKQHAILSQHADKACLIELQGNLYFARTDQLYRKIMDLIKGRTIIVLHFRRVLSIDMSGLVVLMQLVEAARLEGTEIVFAHLHRRLGFGRKTKSAFSMIESDKKRITRLFHSTERALEYAEELILKSEYKDKDYGVSAPVNFEDNDLCENITIDEIVQLKKLAIKQKFGHKEVVVNEDERCCALFLINKGFVEQRIYNGPKSYKVLAKHSPGTYFGKSSFFNKGKVSATYVALGDTELCKIDKRDLETESETIGTDLYANLLFVIGRQLSKEARMMISEIHRLEAL